MNIEATQTSVNSPSDSIHKKYTEGINEYRELKNTILIYQESYKNDNEGIWTAEFDGKKIGIGSREEMMDIAKRKGFPWFTLKCRTGKNLGKVFVDDYGK